jgi:hypothetical protein
VSIRTAAEKNSRDSVVAFRSLDGHICNLIHVESDRVSQRGPVLLVHGAGVRANIFRPPTDTTIVDALLDAGYDVWMENWRASIDLPPTPWTLDEAALYDHPEAVRTVLAQTGATTLKAIIHCQGSTSFMMSAVAGLVPQVSVIVSNAVSLHPVIPALSTFKLTFGMPIFRLFSDYMNPRWGVQAPTFPAKMIKFIVSATHHECDNPVCKQVSFTYGAGFPSLWSHENLDDTTHDWIRNEFAECSVNFFRQIARCARIGHLIPFNKLDRLPESFVSGHPQTDARISLFSGEDNMCFYPESQRRTFDYLDRLRPGYHSLHIIPRYGHLDMFIGKQAARDVFPLMISELERPV